MIVCSKQDCGCLDCEFLHAYGTLDSWSGRVEKEYGREHRLVGDLRARENIC